jgi:NAD+ synthase (glutamine-hydrolysing)
MRGLVAPHELESFGGIEPVSRANQAAAFLRFGFGPRRLARMALHAFGGRYALGEIRRWLLVFLRRFFASQFKRDCLSDAPKAGSCGSLSPRGDWRMPSDASVAAWVAEAETIPDA